MVESAWTNWKVTCCPPDVGEAAGAEVAVGGAEVAVPGAEVAGAEVAGAEVAGAGAEVAGAGVVPPPQAANTTRPIRIRPVARVIR